MRTINEIQDEVIDEFEGFSDWMDRYQLLIDLGNEVSWEEAPDGCRAKGLDCGEHGDTLAVSPLAEYLVVQADTAYILAGLCQ